MPSQIINLDELKKYKEFVLGYGHFNSIHPGHIRYLKNAKLLANKLVIALRGDKEQQEGKPRFQFNQEERAEALALLDIADAILLLQNDELVEVVKSTKPKLLILGKQFENNQEETVRKSNENL